MWWGLFVLVLSIVVIIIMIIIILQQFDGVNTLQYLSDLHKFFSEQWWIILFKFENQLICISKMAAMTNLHIRYFFVNILWLIIQSDFKNQLICKSKWPPWANLHIQDWRKRSPVSNIHQIFAIFFSWTSSSGWVISSRRHRKWDGGSYGFYLRFFLPLLLPITL